jgi:hypothetical protein
MSAQPIEEHDPRDPPVLLHALPERERAEFLRQYHQQAIGGLYGFPSEVRKALGKAVGTVVEDPYNPLRTLPTSGASATFAELRCLIQAGFDSAESRELRACPPRRISPTLRACG